ncbi:chloride conductance regulatory protein ICln isoform X1 [Hevea brasiliensis]|uniref:chloride conductance regulatory protein ICln isoform X1 n=1 Tax=Hevea brasiliensis TaxID=3981 RepID=UPI0025DFC0B0|nr:chloride conductance regulatory protein ICln isoform X1 [Hevea brasiliensis]
MKVLFSKSNSFMLVDCLLHLRSQYKLIETEDDGDESDNSDSQNNEILDLSKLTEMGLVPSGPSQLDTRSQIFCECAELNPEPVDEDEDDQNKWVFSADQMAYDVASMRLTNQLIYLLSHILLIGITRVRFWVVFLPKSY